MFASSNLAPGFLLLAAAAPQIVESLIQGGLENNPSLTNSLQGFNLDSATGLPAMLSTDQIGQLQRLKDGRLSEHDVLPTLATLKRLSLAGAAVNYHFEGRRPGKVGTVATKSLHHPDYLRLAYSPGVAYPSRLIAFDRRYEALVTNTMNTIKIFSDGSAVLGEGALGPYAFQPVGEGKADIMLLMAGLDAISQPIELDNFQKIYKDETATRDEVNRYVREFVETVIRLRPGFGGVNVEDVANKTCFKILAELEKRLGRLVWHDDQQGTAVVQVAGLLSALKIQGKLNADSIRNMRIAVAGAGAAGIVCGRLMRKALRRICPDFRDNQIIMKDSKGLITTFRDDLTEEKRLFAVNSDKTFEQLLDGIDVFVGVSPVGTFKLTADQVKRMADRPIIFALANPDPEILPEEVEQVRSDAIVFTGRSDRKNQANNANSFPGILAGGLDVGATHVTDDISADIAFAMAEVAFEPVLPEVQSLFNYELNPGTPHYAIASAFDPRVHYRVAEAMALSSIKSGNAAFDFDHGLYPEWFLEQRLKNSFVKPKSASILQKSGPLVFGGLMAA